MRPTLPLEVEEQIIIFVHRLSRNRSAKTIRRTLSTCALVCRPWTFIAQALIFRQIPDLIDIQWNRYYPLNSFRGNPLLGTYVRSISCESLDVDFMTCISYCPNITEITLESCYTIPAAGKERLRTLNLALTMLIIRKPVLGDVLRGLLYLWPTIRFLDASVMPKFEPSRPLLPLSGHLRGIKITARTQAPLMAWLCSLQSPSTAIRALELERVWDYEYVIADIAIELGPHIQHLVTPSVMPAAILQNFTALEEYIITYLPATSAQIRLPESISHIGYDPTEVEMWYSEEETQDRVFCFSNALRGLPNLRTVSVTRELPNGLRAVLENVCRAKGAELVVYADSEEFPRAWHVDRM